MVCAAVSTSVTGDHVDEVSSIDYEVRDTPEDPTFEVVAETVAAAAPDDRGPVVAERGEFYGEPDWIVEGAVGAEFKYVETISERKAVQIAHHAAYAGRNLVQATRRNTTDEPHEEPAKDDREAGSR